MQSDNKRSALWIALFVLSAFSLTLPFLFVHEPPLLDYPNHLARTFILNHLHDPQYQFSAYYRADWKPYPYILWDIFMVMLQQVLPVEVAGKLLLILTTLLLPVAATWFLWQVNRTEIKLSLLVCALSYSPMFFWGLEPYHLGMGLCFSMAGTWFWYRRRPSAARAILFFVLSFATYFAHLLGFATGALILVLFELTRLNWRVLLRLACFLAPESLLSLWARPGISGPRAIEWQPMWQRLRLIRGYLIHGYNTNLDIWFLCGLAFCVLVATVGNRELRVNWRWLFVALGFLGLFLLIPHRWGDSYYVNARLLPPLYLLLLAVLRIGRRANWVALIAVALTMLRVFNVTTGFQRETQQNLVLNHGIEHIPRNARVFGLFDDSINKDNFDHFYAHYWEYAVIRRGALTSDLFDIPGQTPMRITFKPYNYDFEDNPEDWPIVSNNYDYVWCYADTVDQAPISTFADPVFKEGALVLYRVRKK